MLKNKAILLSVCVYCVVVLSGCIPLLIGAAAGAGGVAYVKGSLEENFDVPIDKLHAVALDSLKGLDIFVKSDELNVHSSVIDFELGDGKAGKVKLESLTEQSTKFSVKIGTFGDEVNSRAILNEVQRRL